MIWLALKIDEYVPDTMPTRSARAKFRIENPPNRYSAKSVRTTVNDVITDRASVCMIEKLITGFSASPGFSRRFSRMRSNTTIVS